MRCVNRPVLWHVTPECCHGGCGEGSEFSFLTACSACALVRDSGEPQEGLLTPNHSWVRLIFFFNL